MKRLEVRIFIDVDPFKKQIRNFQHLEQELSKKFKDIKRIDLIDETEC